jgi:hypothetical protein
MPMKTDDVKATIKPLQDSFNETMSVLFDVPQESLQQPSAHGCARGGTARDLIVHNIFREKQHTGQVWSVRDQLRLLQGWHNQDLPALLADYYTSRAQLVAALFGLADDQLDAKPKDGGWSIRETVDHVLYWDRNSIDTLQAELRPRTQAAPGAEGKESWPSAPVLLAGERRGLSVSLLVEYCNPREVLISRHAPGMQGCQQPARSSRVASAASGSLIRRTKGDRRGGQESSQDCKEEDGPENHHVHSRYACDRGGLRRHRREEAGSRWPLAAGNGLGRVDRPEPLQPVVEGAKAPAHVDDWSWIQASASRSPSSSRSRSCAT